MNKTMTSSTLIRNLNYSIRRSLSDFLDPQDSWKEILVSIQKPTGEPRYSQHHVRRFEALIAQGKSPTMELLNDWGTSNSTVGDLVDILLSHKLLAPASILLPDRVQAQPSASAVQPTISASATERINNTPTTAMGESTQVSFTRNTPVQVQDAGFFRFSFHELERITEKFDNRTMSEGGRRLGEGGFGTVYKGIIDEKPVAMEDISMEELRVQFNQEVQTLMTLRHENLVDMVGYSCDDHCPCLVYAYMSNGSLLDRLACLDGTPSISWHRRCLIAVGTARGLDYLHRNHHVHRDVKSGNILLDDKLVAKISDFGLTRASTTRSSSTMMTERIVGTTAYMAPEALRGEITPKSDVFSFGVVLLEILSGLPPVDENRDPQFLMEMMAEIQEEEHTLEDFVDKKMSDMEMPQVELTFTLAGNCLCDRKNKRPVIKQVMEELEELIKGLSPEEPEIEA
ncbi:interleukin-1 receptor-associated kinase 4 isoform X2 [Hypomesus transpacificus]|uniref:interleukin-1 receptor-associated kinase 4 isoform X2 n=1 Tax=Hypomesus transpacificus TaxID=137520 RepID=UPI001F084568|nr:interleukin-1 receptor-associated kinase 4 isoform X2 [Hypomesus transpacificus]